jgi:hypothetical protein
MTLISPCVCSADALVVAVPLRARALGTTLCDLCNGAPR